MVVWASKVNLLQFLLIIKTADQRILCTALVSLHKYVMQLHERNYNVGMAAYSETQAESRTNSCLETRMSEHCNLSHNPYFPFQILI